MPLSELCVFLLISKLMMHYLCTQFRSNRFKHCIHWFTKLMSPHCIVYLKVAKPSQLLYTIHTLLLCMRLATQLKVCSGITLPWILYCQCLDYLLPQTWLLWSEVQLKPLHHPSEVTIIANIRRTCSIHYYYPLVY